MIFSVCTGMGAGKRGTMHSTELYHHEKTSYVLFLPRKKHLSLPCNVWYWVTNDVVNKFLPTHQHISFYYTARVLFYCVVPKYLLWENALVHRTSVRAS